MPVTLFFGLLTLAPLALAVVIGALGMARLARAPLALALAALGALAPMVGFILLAPDIIPDQLTQIALLADPSGAATLAFAPVYRLDTIGAYCAFGVAFLVTPLLLWLAWRAAPTVGASNDADDLNEDLNDDDTVTDGDDGDGGDADAPPAATGRLGATLGRWQWSGLALALALESAALSLCFAENILWLALCWLLVVALAWGLGELGAEAGTLDWISLGAMALGPVAWLIVILLVALPAKHWRLIDISGVGGFSAWHVVALGVALACAGGGYPFVVWLRRRAAFAMPAGVGAVVVGVLPAALLVGARTYSALRDIADRWPQFALGAPPITAGIVMTLLGGASVLIAGLLALGRRDGRGLLALLALAQVGWGLIALGVGQPVSALGLVLLLATSVLGLGAALAALVAGRAVTADEEELSAGPRVFGARLSAPSLFAWCVGVASLVGAPLFAGFAPQELISAAALPATKLGIPLVGIAWAGDALLALALIRATALAFVQSPAEIKDIRDAQAALDDEWADDDEDADAADARDDASDEDEDVETDVDDAAVEAAPPPLNPRAQRTGALPGLPELRGDDLPGVILALLIVALGVAPEWLLSLGGQAAASELLSSGSLDGFIQTNAAGYSIAIGAQWLPGLVAWIAVVLIVLVVLIQARATRVVRPVYLAGQSARDLAPLEGEGINTIEDDLADDTNATADAALALAEPTEAWSDLQPAFASAWLTPASQWIVVDDEDDEDDDDASDDDASDDEDGADQGAVDTNDDGRAVAVAAPAKAPARVAAPAASAKAPALANAGVAPTTTPPINATPQSNQSAKGATTAPAANGKTPPTTPARPTATSGATTNGRGAATTGKESAAKVAATAPTVSAAPVAPAKGNVGAAQARPTPQKLSASPAPTPKPTPGAQPNPPQRHTSAQTNGKSGGALTPSQANRKPQQPQPPKAPTKHAQGGSRKHNQRGGR